MKKPWVLPKPFQDQKKPMPRELDEIVNKEKGLDHVSPVTLVKIGVIEDRYNISKSKLYRAVEEDKLPHYRCGRALRFNPEEVLAWMRQQTQGIKSN